MTNDPSQIECIWKPPIKKKIDDRIEFMKFPCRYPEKEKTADVCSPCLLGDIFAMSYTQMKSIQQQQNYNEEIMTYLRNMTSDERLGDFK